MLRFARIATKPAVFQMLTGLSLEAFLDLLAAFHHTTAQIEHQAEQQHKQPRKRQKGSGRKPLLLCDTDRLLFILFYFKQYSLQAVQAFFFGRVKPKPASGSISSLPCLTEHSASNSNCQPEKRPMSRRCCASQPGVPYRWH